MPEGGSSLNGRNTKVNVSLEQYIEDTAERAATLAADKAFTRFKLGRAETCPMRDKITTNKWRVIVLAAFLTGLGILTGWKVLAG